ncbi:hypothetical protein AVEN_153457-1, partial [Araneus ventricosus]
MFTLLCMGLFELSLSGYSITENTPFIIMHTDKTFHKVSPFLIQKLIVSFVGEVKDVKKLKSGDLLIEAATKSQISTLKTLNKLGEFPVETNAHKSLNYSRGVISELDLESVSESELINELKSQKVVEARRIKIKREGKLISTKHIILTFCTPQLPKTILAGYARYKVRPFIPSPLRCFNCQRFGHSKGVCKGKLTCSRCAVAGHSSEECT